MLFALVIACTRADPPPITPTADATVTLSPAPPTTVATEPTSPPTSTPGPTPTVVAPDARPFPEDLRRETDVILDRLVGVRGLSPTGDIGMNLIGRADAIDFYRASITDEDREAVRVQQELYALLGLIPDDSDILALFLDLLGQGIAGFYDSELKAFYLLDDLGGLGSQASQQTIVHELTHALQDQHYNISALSEEREKDWDAATALSSLLEGDAVAAETAYFGVALRTRPSCFTIPVFRLSNPPYVIVRELNSWYDDGLCFVETAAPQLSQGVDGLFENPPSSTEQILHPEKYLAGEQPIAVTLPAIDGALGEGWSLTESSTFGEFSLQNLLILGLPDDRAQVQNATAGWGGDSWAFFEDETGRRFFQATIIWDSVLDAEEFWQALLESVENRASGGLDSRSLDEFRADVNGHAWLVAIEADSVIILVADDANSLGRVANFLETL